MHNRQTHHLPLVCLCSTTARVHEQKSVLIFKKKHIHQEQMRKYNCIGQQRPLRVSDPRFTNKNISAVKQKWRETDRRGADIRITTFECVSNERDEVTRVKGGKRPHWIEAQSIGNAGSLQLFFFWWWLFIFCRTSNV